MFTRPAPTETLTTLMDRLDVKFDTFTVPTSEIAVNPATSTLRIGTREIPADLESMMTLAGWVDFPAPFYKRLDPELRLDWMNALLQRNHSTAIVKVADSGIVSITEQNAISIDPRRIVEVASNVISSDASVIEYEISPASFDLDVSAPEGRMDLGDPKVGDITRGGLRFFHNRRQNLAPTVQPYMYRLVCTNGLEVSSPGLKVDARGLSVDEVLASLEAAAERAFSQVEQDIEHFYELRNDAVENPERTMTRIARERGLSDRLTVRAIETLPSIVEEGRQATMFDLVNHVTNMANDPSIRRRGTRLELERFGGHALAAAHDERCRVCASRLN